MVLYAVVIGDVYPPQCVVVWDTKKAAQALADHLNATVRNVVEVREVDSFFPSCTTGADHAWNDAATSYLRGYHINTSGE